MGFVLIVERLDILQPLEGFSIDLYISFADEVVEGNFQRVSDLAGDLDGWLHFIAFIMN